MPQEIHSPFPSAERAVYGFALYVGTYVLMVIYLLWVFLPDEWLRCIGLAYLPQRYWAVTIPLYILVVIALAIVGYVGATLLIVPPPDSFHTLADEYTNVATANEHNHDNNTIPPLRDIPITEVNKRMFGI